MAYTAQQLAGEDDAYAKQSADAVNAKQSQEALQGGEQPQPSFLQKWVTGPIGKVSTSMLDTAMSAADNYYNSDAGHKARDVVAGAITGAANIADAARSGETALESKLGVKSPLSIANIPQPIWDHAKGAILDFRDAVAVQDPTLADNLTQGAAQLAIPFAGYSRALAGVHGLANVVAAGAATDATALGPHDPRMADLFALGRHVEGKLGDTLRALAPDGSALNGYINYLTDRGNESEAEGRFKNVLDGFGANLVVTPLIHAAAGILKQGTAGLRYAMENGVGSAGDLMPKNQVGAIGERAPLDMSMTPEQRALERERVAAARAREEGITPEPEPEPVPANAAAREGEAARRDRADQSVDAMESSPGDSVVQDLTKNDSYLTDLGMKLSAVNSGAPPVKLHDVLTEMSQKLDDGDPAGAFYKELAGRLADKNLSATITDTSPKLGNNVAWSRAGDNTHGMYHSTSDEVGLFPKAFRNNVVMAHTVTHEAVHAATLDAIKENPELKGHLDGLITAVHNLSPADKGAYGLTNAKEFVAEAESNKSFQDMLKRTKDPDNGGQTLWDQYKVILGGMLGLSGAAIASPHFDDVLTTREEKPRA